MNGLLIDASVTASWLLDDEHSETAQKTLDRMQAGIPAFAPSLWLLEATNLLFNSERSKRIDRRQRDVALDRITRLQITILAAPTFSDVGILSQYAQQYQLTTYDAEYLRVAKEYKLTLASDDGNLLAAARREKVPLIS